MSKFDLPAYFDREYFERHYVEQMAKGQPAMAKTWEDFYFDNAVSFAWVKVFEENKNTIGHKKAMALADAKAKEIEKAYP